MGKIRLKLQSLFCQNVDLSRFTDVVLTFTHSFHSETQTSPLILYSSGEIAITAHVRKESIYWS